MNRMNLQNSVIKQKNKIIHKSCLCWFGKQRMQIGYEECINRHYEFDHTEELEVTT